MMAPVWVPGRPLVAPLRIFSLLSPSCNHKAWSEYRGGERWTRAVWVLWKDVWNRSMGIKGLGSVGGLLCLRLSPLLASMISSIDREALLRSLCVFCQTPHYSFFPLPLYLPFQVSCSGPQPGDLESPRLSCLCSPHWYLTIYWQW